MRINSDRRKTYLQIFLGLLGLTGITGGLAGIATSSYFVHSTNKELEPLYDEWANKSVVDDSKTTSCQEYSQIVMCTIPALDLCPPKGIPSCDISSGSSF